ncbi:hypothetical protein JAAARDRAFT_54481 [Jaapia argillacea MUCL 33604]|uniref:PDZ GRASP-type domain-containing protein n=1 Tax=Jaapia argillacea MUCL 33604 TaxID=933084 RepID=A0A067QGB6_9AGAM|nr:hypothetical protein JAAARDRAFT_54481 [Jaapia argillacea MUCL 33604]
MGAGQSTSSQAHPPSKALHVLRVTPASPASQTDIEAFFDFVVGFEGASLSSHKSIDAAELERIVEAHEDRVLNLLVWNSKNSETRVVPIVPSRAWALPNPDASSPNTKPSLLGLSMRMCEPELSLDNVWHVLDVLEGSPAESAGLVPYGDWIVGWSGGVLSAEHDFYDIVEGHIDKPLRVYVYSHDFDTIREVVLVPNRQWGGEGLLGCVFGFGLLHRIPAQPSDREPGSTPPELQQGSDEFEEQELFVPADVSGPYQGHQNESAEEPIHRGNEQWRRDSFETPISHNHSHNEKPHMHSDHYGSSGSAHQEQWPQSYSSYPEVASESAYDQGHSHHDHDGHDNSHHIHVPRRAVPPQNPSIRADRSSTPTPTRSRGPFSNGDSSLPS